MTNSVRERTAGHIHLDTKFSFLNEFWQETAENKNYLNAVEREQYRIHFDEDGYMSDTEGFDLQGWYMYVLSGDNKLYACPIGSFQEVDHHSYFLAGRPVNAAGSFFALQGQLYLVDNNSGHYCPKGVEMRRALRFFYEASQVSDLQFEDHTHIKKTSMVTGYFVDEWLAEGASAEPCRQIQYSCRSQSKVLDAPEPESSIDSLYLDALPMDDLYDEDITLNAVTDKAGSYLEGNIDAATRVEPTDGGVRLSYRKIYMDVLSRGACHFDADKKPAAKTVNHRP